MRVNSGIATKVSQFTKSENDIVRPRTESKDDSTGQIAPQNTSDTLEISQAARNLSAGLPSTNRNVESRLKSGYYSDKAVLNEVAGSILEALKS